MSNSLEHKYLPWPPLTEKSLEQTIKDISELQKKRYKVLTMNPSDQGKIEWSQVSDPTNWNVADDQDLVAGSTLTAEKLNRAFLKAPREFDGRIAQPNFLQRLLWRALGVTWKDLRPEHDLETLKKLK